MQQMSHMSKKPSAKVSFSDHPYSGEVNIADILSQNTRKVTQVSNNDSYLPRGDWEVSVHDTTSSDDPHDQDVPSAEERLQEQLNLHPHSQNVAEHVDLTEEQQTTTIRLRGGSAPNGPPVAHHPDLDEATAELTPVIGRSNIATARGPSLVNQVPYVPGRPTLTSPTTRVPGQPTS